MSVCTRGFGYLLCWPRGRGIELVCTRRFSFHELCNFLLFNFLIFISFWKTCFFTHDNYPHPRTTTFSYTPFILKTMDSTWANQSKKRQGESGQAYCSYCSRDTLIRYGGTHLLFVEESTLAREPCICNEGNPPKPRKMTLYHYYSCLFIDKTWQMFHEFVLSTGERGQMSKTSSVDYGRIINVMHAIIPKG